MERERKSEVIDIRGNIYTIEYLHNDDMFLVKYPNKKMNEKSFIYWNTKNDAIESIINDFLIQHSPATADKADTKEPDLDEFRKVFDANKFDVEIKNGHVKKLLTYARFVKAVSQLQHSKQWINIKTLDMKARHKKEGWEDGVWLLDIEHELICFTNHSQADLNDYDLYVKLPIQHSPTGEELYKLREMFFKELAYINPHHKETGDLYDTWEAMSRNLKERSDGR